MFLLGLCAKVITWSNNYPQAKTLKKALGNYVIIATEKASDKIQHPFMIKAHTRTKTKKQKITKPTNQSTNQNKTKQNKTKQNKSKPSKLLCIEEKLLDPIKDIHKRYTVNITRNGERMIALPLRARTREGCLLLPPLFNIVLEFLVGAIRKEKEINVSR